MYRCSESLPSEEQYQKRRRVESADETGEIYDSYFQRRDFICNN
jgi:hypothetical protein